MGEKDRQRILERLVIINPFGEYLPEFQILKRDEHIPIEIQAHDVASIFDKSFDTGLGIRQDTILKNAILLGIDQGLTFPEVKTLLENPYYLDAVVKKCSLKDVRDYFIFRFKKENQASVVSLLSRIDNFLMLPSTRLMLSAERNLDFNDILKNKIAIINLGNPPLGCENIAQFWGTFIFNKLTRAIFNRTVEKNTQPALIVCDEWQELLTKDQANQMERILALSRSKRCFLHLVNQQLAQVSKVSSTLLKVLITNTNFQMFFRSNHEDAAYFSHALEITGRRLKPKANFWDPRAKQEFCTPDEELRLLVDEIPRLPDRWFYYFDKRKSYKAGLVYSPTLDVRKAEKIKSTASQALLTAIERGILAKSVKELEACQQERASRVREIQKIDGLRGFEAGPPGRIQRVDKGSKDGFPNLG